MNWIKLEYGHHDISITEEAYAEILRIVGENKICAKCENKYTDEIPEVALNKCLTCFLDMHETRQLTFVGAGELTKYGQEYKFMDEEGYIYLSSSSSNRVDRNDYQTLVHYGFAIPESTLVKGETVTLDSYYWKVYGDLNKSAVVIEHARRYGNDKNMAFISQKQGDAMLLDRRKGEGKYLLERAQNIAETTKDEGGTYHINGREVYHLSDWYLYTIVADLASMEYDISLQLKEAA